MLTGKPIIKNIVDMAHTMDIKVVAEGVETQQQLDFLAQIDCDYFQGYIVTPPVPEAKAVNFLR
jgi:EAL domain-containing protein (putative c-di-GMP-specific phosphodiesterase class I)